MKSIFTIASLALCTALAGLTTIEARDIIRFNAEGRAKVQFQAPAQTVLNGENPAAKASQLNAFQKRAASRADEDENTDPIADDAFINALPTDIIEWMPDEAEVTNYSRNNKSWLTFMGFIFPAEPMGWKCEFGTIADEPNTVYISNIIADMDAAVIKGTKVGDDILIPLPQVIVSYPTQEEGVYETYYVDNVGVKFIDDGANSKMLYKLNHGQDITLKSDGKGGYSFSKTSADGYVTNLGMCGLYYEIDENGELSDYQRYGWNGSSDYDLVYKPVTETPVTVPEEAKYETRAFVFDNYEAYFGEIATTADKLYIFSEDYTTDGDQVAFEASVSGNTATFAPGNFLGDIDYYYSYQGVGTT